MDKWLVEHMHNVLWAIEIMWVGGVLLIFSLPFIFKYFINKNKSQDDIKQG